MIDYVTTFALIAALLICGGYLLRRSYREHDGHIFGRGQAAEDAPEDQEEENQEAAQRKDGGDR